MDTSMAMSTYHMAMASQRNLSKMSFGMEDGLNDLLCQPDFESSLANPQDLTFASWPPTPPRSVRTEFAAPVAVRAPEFTYSLPEAFPSTSAQNDVFSTVFDDSSLVLGQAFQPSLEQNSFMDNKTMNLLDTSCDLDTLLKEMDENSDAIPLNNFNFDFGNNSVNSGSSRRMSSASLLSSVEHMPELGLDNLSAVSESASEFSPFNCTSLITPDVSPRQGTVSGVVHNNVPARSSHSPPGSVRFAVSDKARRATIGAYSQPLNMAAFPFQNTDARKPMQVFPSQMQHMPLSHGAQMSMAHRQSHSMNAAMSSHMGQTSTFIPSTLLNLYQQFKPVPSLLSQSHVGAMLQSSANLSTYHAAHYLDNDPPDLYASLREEQSSPPPEDMNPSDPDMIPHEQELRFEGDLYTPRWVRGHGNKREGWCGLCKPGRWLVLKNSAFWYDKSFSHGVSAATGAAFNAPDESRRMDGNPDVWEGLCGSCHEYVPLVSSKKKGTTWFRHAYKCHTHAKVKDTNKRKRESSHGRCVKPKLESSISPKIEEIHDDDSDEQTSDRITTLA